MSSRQAEDVQEEHVVLCSVLANLLLERGAIWTEPDLVTPDPNTQLF